MKKLSKLSKSALILSIGCFITKAVGAIYRIPLTNILGAEGIGLYQMVFPLYCLLLTLSSTGVPNGIAKLIAEGVNAEKTLKTSLKVFAPIGLIASVLLFLFSKNLAVLQGNINASLCYKLISPSILIVSLICCYRGYFQGFLNMRPTAFSQVVEQVVKCVLGLSIAYAYRRDIILASAGAILAVTLSEFVALLYLFFCKKKSKNLKGGEKQITVKKLLTTVFPVMLSTTILPLTRTLESFIIINILNSYLISGTLFYGLYSGAVESLVGVPVSLLYGIAVSSIPLISKNRENSKETFKSVKESLILTIGLGIIFAVAFFILSSPAVKILYPRFSANEFSITVKMLKLASLSVIFLPLMQTTASILIAVGKIYLPPITSIISAIIKVILTIILLKIQKINILAVVVTDVISYFVACFLNLVYIIKYIKLNKGKVEKWEKSPS